jgi:hypothetical protein
MPRSWPDVARMRAARASSAFLMHAGSFLRVPAQSTRALAGAAKNNNIAVRQQILFIAAPYSSWLFQPIPHDHGMVAVGIVQEGMDASFCPQRHSPVAPPGVPPVHPAPARSELAVLHPTGNRRESCTQAGLIQTTPSSAIGLLNESDISGKTAIGARWRTVEYYPAGFGAAATPFSSSACAIRSATSSRHGAAMIWTPMGSGDSGTGTATTGRPTNEIGWV